MTLDNSEQLNIRIDADVTKRLNAAALVLETSKSELVRRFLEEGLAKIKTPSGEGLDDLVKMLERFRLPLKPD